MTTNLLLIHYIIIRNYIIISKCSEYKVEPGLQQGIATLVKVIFVFLKLKNWQLCMEMLIKIDCQDNMSECSISPKMFYF